MRIAYLDCTSGISGDMVLGALVNAGVSVNTLKRELEKLPLRNYSISASKDERHHISGTNIRVSAKESHKHRTLLHIRTLINKSALSKKVKDTSIAIFENLAKAEAKIHSRKVEDVLFHEVGAVDSIVDIVGAAIGIEELEIERVYASPIPLGSGWVETSHGRMPVPAPATLELLKGIPVVPSVVASELTTPTGAAILKTLAQDFGPFPNMKIEKIGYGIGDKDFKEIPNLLRIVIGETARGMEKVVVIETNIDDMNPQIYEYLMERLFKQGALDVFLMPIQMKKARPAVLLKVMCPENKRDALIDTILRETTSIGVRTYEYQRFCLERKIEVVSTPYGKIRVKVSLKDKKPINVQPEYEDCKRMAEKKKAPLRDVMETAKKLYRR